MGFKFIVKESDKDGYIKIKKEELESMLKEAYEDGERDGYKSRMKDEEDERHDRHYR